MVPLFSQFFFYSLGPKAVLCTNNEKKREREGGKKGGKGGREEGGREKENPRLTRACPRMSQGGLRAVPITSVSSVIQKTNWYIPFVRMRPLSPGDI